MRALALRLLVVGGLLCGLAPVAAGQGITYFPPASGGTVTSPVATDPLVFSGAGTCDNAANTPWVFADGLQDSTLTAGRVTFAGASGRLSDDADLTFATDTLSATKVTVATTLTSPNLVSAAGVTEAISATAPPVPANGATAGAGVTITASAAVPNAGAGTDGAAAGGSVTITAGAAARGTSGNANGGDINLVTGAGIGTGTAGQVLIPVGTAAKPGLAFTGETTDGIYALAGLDAVTIVSGGTATISANSGTTQLRGPVTVMNLVPGGAGTGALYHAVSVETVATTKSPGVVESAELYTNGADVDGQAITLPNDPTVGVCYEFALTSTDTSGAFVIAPSAGETLSDAGTSCATVFSATAAGATARICAVSGGSGAAWFVMSKNGTWTCS